MLVNGDLELIVVDGGANTFNNLMVERLAGAVGGGSLPVNGGGASGAAGAGRMVYNTDDNLFYFYNGTAWEEIGTGSGGAGIQTELDDTQASMGYVDISGNMAEATLNALGNVTGLTGSSTLVDALTQLDAAITAAAGVDTLAELTDVTITAVGAGEFLVYTGAVWENRTAAEANVVTTNTTQSISGAKTFTTGVQLDSTLNADAGTEALPSIHLESDVDTGFYQPAINQVGVSASGSQVANFTTAGLSVTGDVTASGEVNLADGAVGTPSLTFSNDLDTGLYSGNTNTTLNMAVGGVDRLEIQADGTLSVAGTASYEALVTADDDIPNKAYVDSVAGAGVATLNDLTNVTDTTSGANQFMVTDGALSWITQGAASHRTSLGLVAGGAGDIWVEKAGDTMTGTLVLPAGVEATPSLTFTGDPDTGIFLNGTNEIGFTAGGTNRVAISDTTMLVDVNLHVDNGQIRASDSLSSASSPAISFLTDTNTGMYRVSADSIGFSVGGNQALQIESDGTLNVAGTTAYENLVTLDDDIPNKKYVDDSITVSVGATSLNLLTDTTLVTPADTETLQYTSPGDGFTAAQDETDYDGAGSNGVFVGGTGHVVADVITLDDDGSAHGGTTITVDAETAGVITQFTVTTAGDFPTTASTLRSQASTTGSGVGFTITPESNNLTALTATWHNADEATARTNMGLVAGGTGDIWVEKAGDTMSGNLIMPTGTQITVTDVPSAATDVANKTYVDSVVVAGIRWRDPIADPDLVGIAATVPGGPTESTGYIAYNDGAGTGFPNTWGSDTDVNEYDFMYFADSDWINLGNILGIDVRFGVAFSHGTATASLTSIFSAGQGTIADGDLLDWQGLTGSATDPTVAGSWVFPEGRVGGKTYTPTTGTATSFQVNAVDVTASFQQGTRITYTGDTTSASNKTYTVTTSTFSTNTTINVLEDTESATFDGTLEPEILDGVTVRVVAEASVHFNEAFTYSEDNNAWALSSGAGTITAGVGLSFSGSILNVNLGAGVVELPSDEVGVDLFDAATGAIILTNDGTTRTTLTGDRLHLLLNGSGGLSQGASGLAMDAISISTDTGTTETIVGGDTLTIAGGTNVATVGSATDTVTINVDTATTAASQGAGTLGVAEFFSTDFDVTSGFVELNPVGVQESISLTFSPISGIDVIMTGADDTLNLDSSTLTIVGSAGTTPVAGTITIDLSAILSDLNDVDDSTYGNLAGGQAGGEGATYTNTVYRNRIYVSGTYDSVSGAYYAGRQIPLGDPATLTTYDDPFGQGYIGASLKHRGMQVLAWDPSQTEGGSSYGRWTAMWSDSLTQASGMTANYEWEANSALWIPGSPGAFSKDSGSAFGGSDNDTNVFARWDDATTSWRNFTQTQLETLVGGFSGTGTWDLAADTGVAESVVVDSSTTTTNVVSILGGTNGIDTAVTATNTVTISLDFTEFDIGDLTGITLSGALSAIAAGNVLVFDTGSDVYRDEQIHYVESSASATSHVITHNLGQQYVNVTVVDASDDVIIPQNIRMDSSTQITVTLSSAAAVTIIVTGVPGVAVI